MKFYTFYTKNLSQSLIDGHKKVCGKFNIEVEYHIHEQIDDYDLIYTAHGEFMTSVIEKEEVACFLDIDCIPHNIDNLKKAYDWAVENQSFVGNAQNISHTSMRNHVYAAASCLILTKTAWNKLGNPSLSWFVQDEIQIDTAQILTLRADQIGMPYQLMYPIGYDGPEEYKLAGYGMYGRGTLYPATYHWFRISQFKNSIPELWNERIHNVLNDQKIIPKYKSCFYEL